MKNAGRKTANCSSCYCCRTYTYDSICIFLYWEPLGQKKSRMLLKSCQQLIPSIFICLAGVKNKSLRWRDWSLKSQHETLAWMFLLCPTEGAKIHLNHCNEGNRTAELSETELSSLSWLTGPMKDGGGSLIYLHCCYDSYLFIQS